MCQPHDRFSQAWLSFDEWMFSLCRYDCSADIWSFGMTLLELATGSAPYAQLSLDQIMIKTMNDDPPRLQSNDRRKKFSEVSAGSLMHHRD